MASFRMPHYGDEHGTPADALVSCPGCKRSVSPEMLIKLEGEYRCCACRQHAFATGAASREAWYQEHGAPRALQHKARRLAAHRGEPKRERT